MAIHSLSPFWCLVAIYWCPVVCRDSFMVDNVNSHYYAIKKFKSIFHIVKCITSPLAQQLHSIAPLTCLAMIAIVLPQSSSSTPAVETFQWESLSLSRTAIAEDETKGLALFFYVVSWVAAFHLLHLFKWWFDIMDKYFAMERHTALCVNIISQPGQDSRRSSPLSSVLRSVSVSSSSGQSIEDRSSDTQ